MSAKVAICMPVKNRQEAVKLSIQSILDQTYENYVILACDGLSRDNTASVLLDFQNKTNGKLLVYQTDSPGYINTLNYILSFVDADYFCFIDSDDFIQPNKLKAQVEFLENNQDVDIVSSTLMTSDKKVLANSMVDLSNSQIEEGLKNGMPINILCHFQSCLFRKRVLDKFTEKKYFYPEYETGRAGEGFLYTLHYLGYKFANIKDSIYIYTKGVLKDSMSNNITPEFANNIDLLNYENRKSIILELFNSYNPQKKKRGRPKKEEKVAND